MCGSLATPYDVGDKEGESVIEEEMEGGANKRETGGLGGGRGRCVSLW